MAISNTQLLTQKEPDRYKGYSDRERQAAMEFENWDRNDLDRYIGNKSDWVAIDQYGSNARVTKTQAELAAENAALREKYGMTEDKWHYNDLGRLRADMIYGDFIGYGLNSSDPDRRKAATTMAENWYDYLAADDDYGSGSRGSSGSSGSGGGGGYGGAGVSLPPAPQMRSGRSMAELLGVIYDYDTIKGMYRDAVEKKYANLDAEVRRTQDMYYDSIGNSADVLMGALRRGDRDAVRSGTASGTQAATELSALLGASAEAGQGATELAQYRDDLVRKREEELANVTKDALKYYNDLGINLGQLSTSELNALVTAYASEVATLGGIYNTDVLAGVERDRIASQENITKWQLEAQRDIAKWGNASNEEIARITGLSQEEVARITGLSQKEVARITGLSQKEVARITAASNEAVAAKYNNGSGSGGAGSTGDLSNADRLSTLFGIIEKNTPRPDDGFEGNQTAVDNAWKEIERLLGVDLGFGVTEEEIVDAITGAAPVVPNYGNNSTGSTSNNTSSGLPSWTPRPLAEIYAEHVKNNPTNPDKPWHQKSLLEVLVEYSDRQKANK